MTEEQIAEMEAGAVEMQSDYMRRSNGTVLLALADEALALAAALREAVKERDEARACLLDIILAKQMRYALLDATTTSGDYCAAVDRLVTAIDKGAAAVAAWKAKEDAKP